MSEKPTDTPDFSVIIPSNRETVRTTATIPEEREVLIRRDEGLNTARNAGVRAAANEWVVIADDDIEFPVEMVESALARIDKGTLAGLKDFEPLKWVIGRLMIFHKDVWRAVGGFDESREHGGDTDFAIRVEKSGGRILRLNRESVPHHDEETGESMSLLGHVKWSLGLLQEHPREFAPIASRLAKRKLGVSVGEIREPPVSTDGGMVEQRHIDGSGEPDRLIWKCGNCGHKRLNPDTNHVCPECKVRHLTKMEGERCPNCDGDAFRLKNPSNISGPAPVAECVGCGGNADIDDGGVWWDADLG